MLLELGISDAYGAGFEYSNGNLPYNTLQYYVKHHSHPLLPGQYTDDTQMSLAIAELLIEKQGWTPLNIASKFVEVFKRDPRQGYSQNFYTFLLTVKDGKDFLARIKPDSDKSGGAMRATPLGILSDIDDVIHRADAQASITHNTLGGRTAAIASALLSHYCHQNLGSVQDAPAFISTTLLDKCGLNNPFAVPFAKKKVGQLGVDSTHAAISAVAAHRSLAELLKRCINYTGDVDTVAAIAVGSACGSNDYTWDLPDNLYFGLENNAYGRDYLESLDEKLTKLKSTP